MLRVIVLVCGAKVKLAPDRGRFVRFGFRLLRVGVVDRWIGLWLRVLVGCVEGTDGYHVVIPVAVVLEGIEDILAVGVDEIDPGFPERMNDVVDETNLKIRR